MTAAAAQQAVDRPPGRSRRARGPVAGAGVPPGAVTESEREQLRARAAELGVSVPRLMVESALSDDAWTATDRRRLLAELFETRRLLATVANNVNQLARSANISGQVDTGGRLERTLAEVEELLGGLRELTGARR